MIILPPDELVKYISTDGEGNWIHDPNMPDELVPMYEQFVEKEKKARDSYKAEGNGLV